jgi:hypothetical protein
MRRTKGTAMPLSSIFRTTVFLCFIVAVMSPSTGSAKQTSLDARIFEAFERVDERTTAHKQDAVQMRARLEEITQQMAVMKDELDAIGTSNEDEAIRSQRRLLRGKMINLSAEYLNQSFQVLDSAGDLISANLTDLADLADQVRKSGSESGGAPELHAKIQENISAGQSMRSALVELRTWAQQDPSLVDQFQSLRRVMTALDRKVSIDRARLQSRYADPTSGAKDRRLDALDQTLDRLGDMYSQVVAEKQALLDMKDELSIAIQLGRLEMTQEVANHAIPNFEITAYGGSGTSSLEGIATTITELNSSLVEDANLNISQPGSDNAAGSAADLVIDGFSNF